MRGSEMLEPLGLELLLSVILAAIALPVSYRLRHRYWPPRFEDCGISMIALAFIACFIASIPVGLLILWIANDGGTVPAWAHHSVTGLQGLRIVAPVVWCGWKA